MNKFYIILFSLWLGVVLVSCSDNDQITNTYVHVELILDHYPELNAIGNTTLINGGVRGIIVYRKSSDIFQAFERNCTYQPSDANAIVQISDTARYLAVDTSCGSSFHLWLDGEVVGGKASFPLKQYNTYYDAANRLVVISNN